MTLRTVHADAVIHFTTNESRPTEKPPVYGSPLSIKPGGILKAIVIAPGLRPSAVATFSFGKAAHPGPVIRTEQSQLVAKVAHRFQADFAADGEKVDWYICGRRGNVIDRKANPARLVPWLTMDRHSGRPAGTPQAPGQAIILVVAVSRDRDRVLSDARRVVVGIEE